jgi:TetR/AcrR family transcriptional regulator
MTAVRAERRGSDTRARVLDVAEREFARDGFAGAHLQRIAEQVGVQKTALYYYFPSKKDLYGAVLARMLETFDEAVARALDEGGSIRDRTERMLDRLNDLLAENRHYSQILIRIFVDRAPVPEERIFPLIERVVGRLLRFTREGVETGEFADYSERNLFQTLLGAMVFHYASDAFGAVVLDVDDIFAPDAVAWRREQVRRFVLRALLRDPPG